MKIKCLSCSAEIDESAKVCPGCGYQRELAPPTLDLSGVTRPKSVIGLIVCFLVDRTGSSDEFANGIKTMIRKTLETIEPRIETLRVSVVTYGDEDEGQHPEFLCQQVTSDESLEQVGGIVFSGGGLPRESHESAVEFAAENVPWAESRKEARNALVVFSTAETKPTKSGRSAKEIGEILGAKNVQFFCVVEPYPFHYDMCDGCNGLVFSISNDPDPSDIEKIGGQLAATLTASATSGTAAPATVTV